MRKLITVFGLFLVPSTGLAKPFVDILDPAIGTCVANANGLFNGGIPGGEAQQPLSDVTVRFRYRETLGQAINALLQVNGVPISQIQLNPEADGSFANAEFVIPAQQIDDALNVNVEIIVLVPGQPEDGDSEEVNFQLDRVPPAAVFDDATLANVGQCFVVPPGFPFQVMDEQDPNPVVAERDQVNGCFAEHVLRLTDLCGNAQEVNIPTVTPALPGSVDVVLTGYRCGPDACPIAGPDAVTFNDGDRVPSAAIVFNVDSEPNCVTDVSSTYTFNGGQARVLVPGREFDAPGDYQVTVAVGSCGVELADDQISFTIVAPPEAVPGGPYATDQGSTLTLDASGSSASPEFGGIVGYAWDFDNDGFYDHIVERQGAQWIDAMSGEMVANETEATFDATLPDGTYQVWLRITTGDGRVEFASTEVEVRDVSPTCQINGPFMGAEGQAITLNGVGSMPGHPIEPIISYEWDFGDGTPPQNGNGLDQPLHIFAMEGVYNVTLTVRDVDSEDSCSAMATVTDSDPVINGIAAFNANNLTEGNEVTFTAGQTAPGSAFDPITNYAWSFGPEGATEQGAALRNPRYTYPDDGTYEVCLEVSDEDSSTSECFDIEVQDLRPIADIDGPNLAGETEVLDFSARNTRAGGAADPLSRVVWDFGDGSDPQEILAPGPYNTQHAYQQQGNYTVTISVFDEDQDDPVTAELEVSVRDVVPTADLVIDYLGQANGFEGQPVRLDASASVAGSAADPIVQYRFEFGDGTDMFSDVPAVEHTYPDQGTYQASVTVIDVDDSAVQASVVVAIENIAPVVEIELLDEAAEIGQPVSFRAIVTDVDADLPLPKVQWDMGDGTILDTGETEIEYTYNTLGSFVVTVHVDDFDGTCRDQPACNEQGGCGCVGLSAQLCDDQDMCNLIGGDDDAETMIEITAAAPRLQRIEPQVVREGELLEFTIALESAPQDGGGFDGPLDIGVPRLPPGAEFELVNGNDPDELQTLHFSWQPSFFDAGEYILRVTAVAPSSGIDRTREIAITVLEGGAPLLAAVGGRGSRGQVTIYTYERNGDRTTFAPRDQVDVGIGAAGLAIDGDGRRIYVGVPGSGGVAVVNTLGESHRERLIPTGDGAAGVAWAPGRVWVVNSMEDSLSVIDTETLKVIQTIDLGLRRPTDIAYLPAGFDGIPEPRLAIVSSRDGNIALVDPEEVEAGEDGVESSFRIGGVLNRVIINRDSERLHVADGKTRRVYTIRPSTLLAGGDPIDSSFSTDFGPRDLLATDGTLWVATDGGLVKVVPGEEPTIDSDIAAKAVTSVSTEILSEGGVAAAVGDRIEHYDPDLQRLIGAVGSRVRRLTTFIARE